MLLLTLLFGCDEKNVDTGSLFGDDVSPVLMGGRIWCNQGNDEAGPVHLFFLEAEAADPQGDLDLSEEANWTATLIQDGQIMVEDHLYWEDGKYVYSFHEDQHPNIECNDLDNFRFVVQTSDWSGNVSNEIELEVLGFLAAASD